MSEITAIGIERTIEKTINLNNTHLPQITIQVANSAYSELGRQKATSNTIELVIVMLPPTSAYSLPLGKTQNR